MKAKDYFDTELINWLRDNDLDFKLVNSNSNSGDLIILYSDKFCLKIYDRYGHGFSLTVNVADKYDESMYENDNFSLTWVFEYLKLKETASFKSRTENEYQLSLPNLIADIKTIIPRLTSMTSQDWHTMTEWINKEAKRQFS